MAHKNLIKLICLLLSPFIFIFSACETDMPTATNEIDTQETMLLNDVPQSDFRFNRTSTNYTNPFTPSTSVTIRYISQYNSYSGGMMMHPNGALLLIAPGALTPPQELMGQDVTITMTIVKDSINNELTYTFSPHGCTFSMPTTLWISWSDLGSNIPDLFYIDDQGNYILQPNNGINLFNKTYILSINHFSRYAVAYGR